MRAAILDGNTVTNIATVVDQAFADSQGWIVSETARIGDTYANGVFTTPAPPPAPTPDRVTRRQGKQQLVIAGHWDQVQAAIDGITDETERLLTRIYFDDAETWGIDHPQLRSLADALGLSDTQVDDLFTAAAQR